MATGFRSSPVRDRLASLIDARGFAWRLAIVGSVGLLYYSAAEFGLSLSLVGHNVTPLWPPTGIAVVAFLLFGPVVWPAVAIAAFAVNLPISDSPIWAAVTALGNTLAPLATAALLRRVDFRLEIDRLRDAIAIVAAALIGMTISASIGTAALVLSHDTGNASTAATWAVWWTGDAMGVLVVAPFLLSLLSLRARASIRPARAVEIVLLFVSIAVVTVFVTRRDLNLTFAPLPLLGWAAWRYQLRVSATGALIVCGIACWAAARGIGPFGSGALLPRMLGLQFFDTSVAFASFFFSAAVSERLRARTELETAATELEARVEERTAELRSSERLLAETQRIARTGSWEWRIAQDRVEWSEEMYRIYGYEDRAPMTFARAVERVVPEDLDQIRSNVERYLAERETRDLPSNEFRIVRPDGTERTLRGKSRLIVGPDGTPIRLVGWVQDVTEERLAEHEHRIAETLQRSLLLEELPEIPGLALAAKYVPASAEMVVGGDWYDVFELPDGSVGLAIGDVAGHGLTAASTMGQLRTALRVYAFEDPAPVTVLARLHGMAREWLHAEMATVLYALFDLGSGAVRFANAGHPPPLVVSPAGGTSFIRGGLAPPLGASPSHQTFVEATAEIAPGDTLVLYTDGLVERRDLPIGTGLDRLEHAIAGEDGDVDALVDHLIARLVADHVSDDVAVLALRPTPLGAGPLRLVVPTEPRRLAPLRHTVRRWLAELGTAPQESNDVMVACMEACTNVIRHAGASRSAFEVVLEAADGSVAVTVRDRGRWRPPVGEVGGRGLDLMRGLMDRVEIDPGPDGTTVLMVRALEHVRA
jgi:PAS domain S-box-containing protein